MPSSFYVVTGSSRGIGKAICDALLRSPKNHVVGVARSPPAIAHANYSHVQMDLADVKAITQPAAFDSIFSLTGGPYGRMVLVNNAGILHTAYLGEADPPTLASLLCCNITAPTLLMDDFVRRFRDASGTRMVVNISSGVGNLNPDGWAAYAASKAALDRVSQVMQLEQDRRKTGIRVFSVHPGPTHTMMEAATLSVPGDHFLARASDRAPLKLRRATPELTARRILAVLEQPDRFFEVVVEFATLRAQV